MRGVRLLLAFLVACGPSGKQGTEIPKSTKPLTPKDIVARSSPAIVRIEAQGPDGEQFGTGFIVDKSGVVATNFHVIAGTKEIRIKLHDGSHYPVMHVLNVDPIRDLVIVKFAPEKPMPTLRLGDSDKVSTGEKIVAIGNPLGVFENTVSEGLISSIREVCSQKDVDTNKQQCPGELTLLQISAPISQGSSGGPLFNQVGEVVGVTTAIIAQGQLINFAMPANYLKPLLAQQEPIALEDFARATSRKDGGGLPKKPPEPPHATQGFPVSVYDGCKLEQIAKVVETIDETIELGAPLYNQRNYEACFRIYENTSTKLEKEAPCKGVRQAFGDVLLKMQTVKRGDSPGEVAAAYAEKAWHIRYTFDGLKIAARNWTPPGPKKK